LYHSAEEAAREAVTTEAPNSGEEHNVPPKHSSVRFGIEIIVTLRNIISYLALVHVVVPVHGANLPRVLKPDESHPHKHSDLSYENEHPNES